MRIEQDYSGSNDASSAVTADTNNDENTPQVTSTIPQPPPYPEISSHGSTFGGYSKNLNKNTTPLPLTYNNYEDTPKDQDGHLYVGLVNQAMTCYLNSLIQTLYMTPEFRNILYEWQYNGTVDEAAKSIPFQLQKLFALLQTTNKNCLETKDLTASFGWEGNDAYEQHDVQELSRVMLEALEHRFRKSEQHRTFIQNLYKGTMEDVVKCLGCKREKVRQDIYNDLALAIREFGATESYKSIEEALRAFTTKELLTGNNKYKCENCNNYQEAEKGFRFTSFPYLLAIQLKRFTLDYTTGYRVKLNDKMTFPDYLDLNNFMNENQQIAKPTKMTYAAMANKKPETIKEDEDLPCTYNTDGDGWINKPSDCEEVQTMLKNGKYVYELFAVLIHQGSATGGHYFAYVKNLEQSQWLCFNDTQVKSIDADEIKKCFGGSGWCNNMNAYMMVYRQIDPEKNQKFKRMSELPQHVLNWLKQWKEEENRQAVEKVKLENMVKVKVLLNDERILIDDSNYGALECSFSKDEKASEIVEYFSQKFTELGIFVDATSAVLFLARHTFNFIDGIPIDLNIAIDNLIFGYSTNPELNFVMELKLEDCELPSPSNKSFLRTLDLLTVDISFNTVRMCKRLAAYDGENIGSLRQRISKLFPKCSSEGTSIRMVLDFAIDDGSPLVLIDDDSKTLSHLADNKFQMLKFYIDCGRPEDLKADRSVNKFEISKMCKIIEKRKYGTRIKIQLPSTNDYRQAGLCPPSSLSAINKKEDRSPPVSPISKKFCQLGPLNEREFKCQSELLDPITSKDPTSTLKSFATDSVNRYVSSFNANPPNSPVNNDELNELDTNGIEMCTSPDDMEIDGHVSNVGSPNVSDNEDDNGQSELNQKDDLPVFHNILSLNTDLYSDAYEYPEYMVDVIAAETSEVFNCNYVTVLIDYRQLTMKLVEWLARYLKLHADNISLAKHYNDTDMKKYEITLCPDETIKVSFASVNRITVSLRVPTKEDEKLIRVVEFDLNNENIPDQWPTLFSVAASSKTTFAELKEECLNILEVAYMEKYSKERIRLREITAYGCPIIDLKLTFEQKTPKDQTVLLQKLKVEEITKFDENINYQPIIVRRFCPSTLEIMAPFEVMIPAGDQKAYQILKQAIAKRTNLIPERIAFSELFPKGGFQRWPYTKSPLDLWERTFTDIPFQIEHGGKLVYFIDRNEQKKHITEEDRRAMHLKEKILNNNTQRRTERPLRIQMSSVSESDQ